ncbi:hypothetical protein LCGC14_2809750 [marine sediment metagenome]|uniref:Uncharacterized protein n=1 Tax=marine sediment metagenome TaxID=412755 RepID=A0A0F9BBI0_9ZZZZ|nr:hypothetical protein [Phycisphaerales bacterium]
MSFEKHLSPSGHLLLKTLDLCFVGAAFSGFGLNSFPEFFYVQDGVVGWGLTLSGRAGRIILEIAILILVSIIT